MRVFRSRKRWNRFSVNVDAIRCALRSTIEKATDIPVVEYNGSDSWLHAPDSFSIYKLVPFDGESMPPLYGLRELTEGVVFCADCEAIDRAGGYEAFPAMPWHRDTLTYKVVRARCYRVVPFSINDTVSERTEWLDAVERTVRILER